MSKGPQISCLAFSLRHMGILDIAGKQHIRSSKFAYSAWNTHTEMFVSGCASWRKLTCFYPCVYVNSRISDAPVIIISLFAAK